MNNSTSGALAFAILVLSYVLYQAWVVVPREKMAIQSQETISKEAQEQETKDKKQELLKEYEDCKDSASIQYSLNWLRQCNTIKPLSKDCLIILENDFPWDLYYTSKIHQANGYPEYTKERADQYYAFAEKLKNCQCKSLPGYLASALDKDLENNKDSCLKEFESMSKTIP